MTPWGDPSVSELLQLEETQIQMPNTTGGIKTQTMQRAGLLRKLRFIFQSQINVSAYTNAPTKSGYGPLGAGLNRIRVEANGQIPLVDMSGLGAAVYNEIQNRDGSVLSPGTIAAVNNMTAAAELVKYDTVGATGDFYARFPFEINFALPFQIRGFMEELGLWLLQNQAIDLSITAQFNDPVAAAAANNVLWGGGTNTKAGVTAGSFLKIERELYTIPADPKDYPNLTWAHQIVEQDIPFTGGVSRIQIPRAGLMLRAALINLDSSGNPIESGTEVSSLKWQYGSNETPISRSGLFLDSEYLSDYNRRPLKGVNVLDFYKWGDNGLKFVKNTEDLANLRIETNFASVTTGTQKLILDRLIPVGVK